MAYNLSPSFNWDTTGMTDEMRFLRSFGKMGCLSNLINLRRGTDRRPRPRNFRHTARDGMLALARLQRKMRLVESLPIAHRKR